VFAAGSKGDYLPANGQIQQMRNENMNYLSWKTGVFTFSKTPLNEVCNILSSHYKVNIQSTLKNPGHILTGTFQNEDLEDILSTIAITLDLKVTRLKSGGIIIQHKNQ
jgi:ferric-dicitrate binding protein FerR (iron transport regulator)